MCTLRNRRRHGTDLAQLAGSLVLNKTDLATPERLLERTAELSKMHEFERVFILGSWATASTICATGLPAGCRKAPIRPG